MKLTWRAVFRCRKVRFIAPIAILGLVLSACSPGSAITLAAVFGGVASGPIFPKATTFPTDHIKLNVTCVITGGHCGGFISAQLLGGPAAFGANFYTTSFGGGGGFFTVKGSNCTSGPCPEGGQFLAAGFGSLSGGGSQSVVDSYSLRAFDQDPPLGKGPDTIQLNICAQPTNPSQTGACGTPSGPLLAFTETFTCGTAAAPLECIEINLRPGVIGTP